MVNTLVFEVSQEEDGGFVTECLTEDIFTQGDSWEELKTNIKEDQIVNQEGSHIILETQTPSHHRLCIPDHNPLRVETLNAILSAVSRHKGTTKQDILNP